MRGPKVVLVGIAVVVAAATLVPAEPGAAQPAGAAPAPVVAGPSVVQAAPVPFTVAAWPRVARAGTRVLVTGTGCSAMVRVLVEGRPAGWYDIPHRYATRVTKGGPGAWRLFVVMPPEPAAITASCVGGPVQWQYPTMRQLVVSPSGSGPVVVRRLRPGITLELPPTADVRTMRAFTESGRFVAMRAQGFGSMWRVRVSPPRRTKRVVLVAWEFLGENAEAHQVVRPQAWVVVL